MGFNGSKGSEGQRGPRGIPGINGTEGPPGNSVSVLIRYLSLQYHYREWMAKLVLQE